ncbi:hypothetical protein JTB14_010971 [Gonioctena quinquepunctata]|nr:hypothetical protein JTB14_010971 [Gonioctena quinquepunctata]
MEPEVSMLRKNYDECIILLKDKKTLIAALSICVCTSSMAILEPCVPMWLLARLNPPPSRWQLGAVFIPDSIGYFIGSQFAGLLPVLPWRIVISSLVLTGLSCCALPLANTISQLFLPHFGIGLGVGAIDAALVPLLASFVDNKGSTQYGPIYALQQAAVSISYSFGPLLGGQAIHILGFPWLMRIVGFVNLMVCPLLLELEEQKEKKPLTNNCYQPYSSIENNVEVHPANNLFCQAYLRAWTEENAINAFRKCGIHPFDSNLFQDFEFSAATVTDQSIEGDLTGNNEVKTNENHTSQEEENQMDQGEDKEN